jgi:hypothetical protein
MKKINKHSDIHRNHDAQYEDRRFRCLYLSDNDIMHFISLRATFEDFEEDCMVLRIQWFKDVPLDAKIIRVFYDQYMQSQCFLLWHTDWEPVPFDGKPEMISAKMEFITIKKTGYKILGKS